MIPFLKWFSTWWVCWVRWHQCRLLDLDACRLSRLRWWLRKTSWSYKSELSSCKRRMSSWLWTPSSGWVLARAGQPSDSSDANRRVWWSLERLWEPPSIRRRRRPMAREQQKRRVEAFRRTCRLQTAKKKSAAAVYKKESANRLTFLSFLSLDGRRPNGKLGNGRVRNQRTLAADWITHSVHSSFFLLPCWRIFPF